MERGIIDRFEGEWVVIEIEGTTRNILKSFLPEESKVGDAVIIENGAIRVDAQETAKRKTEAKQLMDELFE
jgi:hydrogenase maturation factor